MHATAIFHRTNACYCHLLAVMTFARGLLRTEAVAAAHSKRQMRKMNNSPASLGTGYAHGIILHSVSRNASFAYLNQTLYDTKHNVIFKILH